MTFVLDLVIIVILTAVANSLLGSFLVLRGTSLISFGLAHSILFGIVLAFLVTSSLTSPLLLVGAALTGILVVSLVELLSSSKLVQYDAALGLIYLTIFGLGIIFLSRFAGETTLSINSVVSGQLVFAPFIRASFLGINLPRVVWVLSVLVFINIGFIVFTWKELLLTSFDPVYADLLGKSSRTMALLLMSLTSLTIVGSYTAVGAILVVAFMITPPASARLYTKQLPRMVLITLVIAITGGIGGLFLALELDISPAGTISVVYGMIFLISMLVAPYSDLSELLTGKSQELQPPPSFTQDHGGR